MISEVMARKSPRQRFLVMGKDLMNDVARKSPCQRFLVLGNGF